MKKAKWIALIVVVMLILSLALTGCTGAPVAESAPAEAPASEAPASEAPASEAPAQESAPAQEKPQAESTATDVAGMVAECAALSGADALAYFESLADKGLSDDEIMQFFIDLPVSQANADIYKLYQDEGFETYGASYPKPNPYDNFVWEKGSGTEIVGEFSKNNLKLPFTDYVPIDGTTIGDANKTYTIGVAFHGFSHPWLINWADAAKYAADQFTNVKTVFLDGEFDNNTMANQIDTLIAQKVDGILVWPMVEAPTGPPIDRALQAGIPVVTSDRLSGSTDVTSRVSGNFPANGAQTGMYLVWKLAQENNGAVAGNVIMLRKPLGSTADAVRTGHFLKVISYFPDIKILQSYHDTDSREEAFINAQTALQAYPDIDAFFGTGDHEALAAYEATVAANRLNSRADGKKIIFLSIDDSKEAITQVKDGNFEVNTPYTPLQSDIAMRVLLKVVAGESMPQDVTTPNIPMVTTNGDKIFGLQSQKPDEWYQYTFGPPIS